MHDLRSRIGCVMLVVGALLACKGKKVEQVEPTAEVFIESFLTLDDATLAKTFNAQTQFKLNTNYEEDNYNHYTKAFRAGDIVCSELGAGECEFHKEMQSEKSAQAFFESNAEEKRTGKLNGVYFVVQTFESASQAKIHFSMDSFGSRRTMQRIVKHQHGKYNFAMLCDTVGGTEAPDSKDCDPYKTELLQLYTAFTTAVVAEAQKKKANAEK